MTISRNRTALNLSGTAQPGGGFEILAITAGEGNGWQFSPATLRTSLACWENVECFIDHDLGSHSVRDLAGICRQPLWDETTQGITLQLEPLGPSAPLLIELGRQLLTGQPPQPKIGFSADVVFTANGREVQDILRVRSVDLVFNPARGGAFLRALNSVQWSGECPQKDQPMTETVSNLPAEDLAAAQHLLSAQVQQTRLKEEAEHARQARQQLCSILLDTSLRASQLPLPMQERLRSQFKQQIFEVAALNAAIEDARKLVSELTGAAVVSGPGRLHAMYSTGDRLQAAMDDLLGAPRDPGQEKLAAPRASGIRELYLSLTGDYDLHGGYFPERTQLASTADFTGLVKNAMNKIVAQRWSELGKAGYDWWNRIAAIEHFNSLQSITGTLIGTVGTLPTVAEGAEYTELAVGDSPETASFVKYGGYIPLTLELIDRDDARKLRAYPAELAAAGLRKLSALVAAIFTDNAGIGATMADSGALFNATALTSLGGHANLLTTALSASQWDLASTAVYNQPMLVKLATGYYGTGPKMAINPRYCLVPRNLWLTACKILYPAWENTANIHSENLQQGSQGDVVVVPDWTDANDWAAVCDPRVAPAIFIGERFGIMPEVFIAGDSLSPAVFMNDEHRLKVRHFLAVWVNDFRPLHKSNVA
jgi:hypothetical protein